MFLLRQGPIIQGSKHLYKTYQTSNPVYQPGQTLPFANVGQALHTTAAQTLHLKGTRREIRKQKRLARMDEQQQPYPLRLNNKQKRNAARASRFGAETEPAITAPAPPGFDPFNHIGWRTFTTQAQDQTQFLSQFQHTPFWPTPVHHQMKLPDDYRSPPSQSVDTRTQQPHTMDNHHSNRSNNHPPNRGDSYRPNHTRSPPNARRTPPPPSSSSSTKKTPFRPRDAIIPPSPASGGVPDPSPSYLLRASFLPQELPSPHPLLVIIDLNGTLLHRPSRLRPHSFVARPHAREFLTYCVDTFSVVIWSSARMSNVRAMCSDLLSPAQLDRVLAVWGREHFGLTPQDYNARVQCYKRLTRVWEDEAIQAGYPDDWDVPGSGGGQYAVEGAGNKVTGPQKRWDQGNTVLIDDSAEKARSEPYNAIQIPEFTGSEKRAGAVLPQVHDYINLLACQTDVSTYIRANPFKVKG